MFGSLMFVAYQNEARDGVTVSPRLGDGHSMPEHTDAVKVTPLEGSGLVDGIFSVNAMCTGCRSWDGGSLDIQSTSQPMIMAIGPASSLASDELNEPIGQHQLFGDFTLNLVEATGAAGVPLTTSSNSTTSGSPTSSDEDDDYNGLRGWRAPPRVIAHALLMIAAFLILFPGGYLVLRVFEKVVAHAAVQAVAMLFVIISTALGISFSKSMSIVSSPFSPSRLRTSPSQRPRITMLISSSHAVAKPNSPSSNSRYPRPHPRLRLLRHRRRRPRHVPQIRAITEIYARPSHSRAHDHLPRSRQRMRRFQLRG